MNHVRVIQTPRGIYLADMSPGNVSVTPIERAPYVALDTQILDAVTDPSRKWQSAKRLDFVRQARIIARVYPTGEISWLDSDASERETRFELITEGGE